MMQFGTENPFAAFMEDEPKAGYFGYQDKWKTPNMKKYFQGQFGAMQDQYMGMLGKQIMGGGAPTQSLSDWLSKIDWEQQYAGLTPNQKGMGGMGGLAPASRWLV